MSSVTIPRRFHLYWTGRAPGRQELACLRSVRHCHPDWEIVVHVDGEATSFDGSPAMQLADRRPLDWLDANTISLLRRCAGAAMRSDVVRFAALHQWGGVWLDFDVVCLRPFDELCSAPGFAGSESFGVIGSSVIGAPAGSNVIRRARQLVSEWLDPDDRLCIGPRLLTRAVLDEGSDWHILEPEEFYPWRWSESGASTSGQDLDGSFAVHLCQSLGTASESVWKLLAAQSPVFRSTEDEA